MSEGRNISNNEQQKAYDENMLGMLVKQRKKQHSQFESSKEWRELRESKVSEGTVYESAKPWTQLEGI